MTGCNEGEGMASTATKCNNESPGDVVVSKDINLDIHDGSSWCLSDRQAVVNRPCCVGMIAGLETITSGDLFIGETRMNDISRLPSAGMVLSEVLCALSPSPLSCRKHAPVSAGGRQKR